MILAQNDGDLNIFDATQDSQNQSFHKQINQNEGDINPNMCPSGPQGAGGSQRPPGRLKWGFWAGGPPSSAKLPSMACS